MGFEYLCSWDVQVFVVFEKTYIILQYRALVIWILIIQILDYPNPWLSESSIIRIIDYPNPRLSERLEKS